MDISKLTIVQLKDLLRSHKIRPLTGNKSVLVQRVKDNNIYENHIKTIPYDKVKQMSKPETTVTKHWTHIMNNIDGVLAKHKTRKSKMEYLDALWYLYVTTNPKIPGLERTLLNAIKKIEIVPKTTHKIPTQTIIYSKPTTIKREPKIADEPIPIQPFEDVMDIILPKVLPNLPKDMNPIIDKLTNDIDELQTIALQHPDFTFKPSNEVTSVVFLSVLEKYKNPALIVDIEYKGPYQHELPRNPLRAGFTVVIPPRFKGNDFKIDYKTLGKQLQYYKDLDVICIPFNFISKIYFHGNMLIYKPKLGIVEHFEPNGGFFMLGGISEYIQRCMRNLFVNQLTPWIGPVQYVGTGMVCPKYNGLQRLSKDEGCAIWSVIIADFALSNPTMALSNMIPKILDIAKHDAKYVRNIIHGYIIVAEKMISKLLQKEITYTNKHVEYDDYYGRIDKIKAKNKQIYK
jgi:hypothetical protein